MPIYMFGCTQGHRTEHIRPVDTASAECSTCGESCGRVYGYSVAITQPEADSRGMFRRFQEASHDLEHRGYSGPNLWQANKQRARAMDAAGENPYQR